MTTTAQAKARRHVMVLRRAGFLVAKPCEACGSTDRIEAHHPFGYEGENAINVWWLCPKDHISIHRKSEQAAAAEGDLVTLTEAAAFLNVTPDTLRQQIHAGKLRAEKRGRDWFVSSREVERYRLEHRRKGSGA